MADSIKGISGTPGAASGGGYAGGGPPGDHGKKRAAPPQKDLVEISREARERLAGKKRISIFEFLRKLLE